MKTKWLVQVCTLANADTGDRDVEHLAKLLSETEEVLPWVLGQGGGFAEWPLARQALTQVAKNFTRATKMRPDNLAPQITLSPSRPELYDKGIALMTASDVRWDPSWHESGPKIDDVIGLINQVRRDEGGGKDCPSIFIGLG